MSVYSKALAIACTLAAFAFVLGVLIEVAPR